MLCDLLLGVEDRVHGLQKLDIEGAQPSVLVVSGLHSSQEAGCCFEPSGKQPYIIEESW